MKIRLAGIWERLGGTLWFVPGLVAFGGIVLAGFLVELSDVLGQRALANLPRIFTVDAASSRSALATIAGSIITVAGVTFSITVLVLAQTASQYTPRVLRNFMRDRPSQVALGVLAAVFLYCLVVIRTIRTGSDASFVPAVAVLAAFVLAAVAIATLVYFVHHVAESLEAGNIIARVSEETLAAIERLYPEALGNEPESGEERDDPDPAGAGEHCIAAPGTGYIQEIDVDELLSLAERGGIAVRFVRAAGDFVVEGQPLVLVCGGEPDDTLVREIGRCVTLGTYRTVLQDVRFGLRQLVDIALKALSPGINDVTTAITSLDFIEAILLRLAGRRIQRGSPGGQGGGRKDSKSGALIVRGPVFRDFLAEALEEIRRAGAGNPRVLNRMLEVIAGVGRGASSARRALLYIYVERVLQCVDAEIRLGEDRAALHARALRIRAEWQR